MKKIILSLMIFVLVATSMFVAVGCVVKGDGAIVKENVEKLIENIVKEDREAIKAMFASNKIADIENFDESIEELLAYFEGDFEGYLQKGLVTGAAKDDGITQKYYNISCNVTTSVTVYRMALIWHVKDTGDSGNVGIWRMYILKYDDDPNQEYAYWGDSDASPGIHVHAPLFLDDEE